MPKLLAPRVYLGASKPISFNNYSFQTLYVIILKEI